MFNDPRCEWCNKKMKGGTRFMKDSDGIEHMFCSDSCVRSYSQQYGVGLRRTFDQAMGDALNALNDRTGKLADGMESFNNGMESLNNGLNTINDAVNAFKTAKNNTGCFITTATCHSRNLPDDCHELTVLRNFRDTYMLRNDDMKLEVAEYYEIAPKICRKIDEQENSFGIYENIWRQWLQPAIDAIDDGKNETAYNIYKQMVLQLKSQYL